MSPDHLYRALVAVSEDLDTQISVIENKKEDPFLQRYPDGRYVLADILVAKAHVLVAIAQLNRERISP